MLVRRNIGWQYYRQRVNGISPLLCKNMLIQAIVFFVCVFFNRRIFVYTFCLINMYLSLSDDANKIKTLNIERA